MKKWITLTSKHSGAKIRIQSRHITSYGASGKNLDDGSWVALTGDVQDSESWEVRESPEGIEDLLDIEPEEAIDFSEGPCSCENCAECDQRLEEPID